MLYNLEVYPTPDRIKIIVLQYFSYLIFYFAIIEKILVSLFIINSLISLSYHFSLLLFWIIQKNWVDILIPVYIFYYISWNKILNNYKSNSNNFKFSSWNEVYYRANIVRYLNECINILTLHISYIFFLLIYLEIQDARITHNK